MEDYLKTWLKGEFYFGIIIPYTIDLDALWHNISFYSVMETAFMEKMRFEDLWQGPSKDYVVHQIFCQQQIVYAWDPAGTKFYMHEYQSATNIEDARNCTHMSWGGGHSHYSSTKLCQPHPLKWRICLYPLPHRCPPPNHRPPHHSPPSHHK